ncbi:MAG: heavy metal-binding domain-containing protein [Myxococcota bacterium]|nr:heavy metal-binding domain-containing protein [Myxococcota bacterium]
MNRRTKLIVKVALGSWAALLITACVKPSTHPVSSGLCARYSDNLDAPGSKNYCAGREALQANQTDKALQLYKAAAKESHIGAQCFVAAMDESETTKTSSVVIEEILNSHPKDTACLILIARESIFENELTNAIQWASKATVAGKNDPLAWTTLGFAHFRKQDYIEAAEAFKVGVKIDSRAPENVFNVGYAYYLGGEYSSAGPWLARALKREDLAEELKSRATQSLKIINGALWICPMHPEIVGKKGDTCSICRMNLEPVSRGISGQE